MNADTPAEAPPVLAEAVPPPPSRTRLRLVRILTVLILIGAVAGTLYIVSDPGRLRRVEELITSPSGLVVLFVFGAITSATLVLPVPGLALTAIAGSVANPFVVGIVAGAGQTLGEMTGYMAGYSGQTLIDDSPRYARLVSWMRRFGAPIIFVLALLPIALFDVAGIIAGALRMPVWLYLLSASAGKIIKNVAVAYAAAYGMEWLKQLFNL
ncbi:MAG TPA: VTT domain-containing protein [Anaerolineae bacterium]|nr:VTT domain-containing protein [Anaerolineae bacterium]